MCKRSLAEGLVGVALFVFAATVGAQAPERLGDEFQVNSYTTSYQTVPAVSRDSDGRFVVAWSSLDQDQSQGGVFARRFDAAGIPLAAEFQVNSYTPGVQGFPDVAVDADGSFVVVWASSEQDGHLFGVFGRRFDTQGTPLAVEFQINTRTDGSQYKPAIATGSDGDFVVVWYNDASHDGDGTGIFAQRFDSAGASYGLEFQVNTFTPNDQYSPDVALDDDGDFVVVWRSQGQDGSDGGIFAQRFDSVGAAGIESPVNTFTEGAQVAPKVAIEGDGDFVVTWHSYEQDGSATGVFARRFDAFGAAQAVEFQVSSYTEAGQAEPDVAVDGSGHFAITWQSFGDGDENGVIGQLFGPTGSRLGSELQVNTYTPSHQAQPRVAFGTDGGFVIAWRSYQQDGDSHGVFAQRFTRVRVLDIDGNGDVAPLTDGLLVLRFLFGFNGTTLTAGAVGGGCTRCNAAAIEPYPSGLV